MKRKPTHAEFIRAAIAAYIRWHDSGTVTHKDDGRKIGSFLKCDHLTEEQRAILAAALGPWVVFRTSRSEYAPEQVRALVILLSAPEMQRQIAAAAP